MCPKQWQANCRSRWKMLEIPENISGKTLVAVGIVFSYVLATLFFVIRGSAEIETFYYMLMYWTLALFVCLLFLPFRVKETLWFILMTVFLVISGLFEQDIRTVMYPINYALAVVVMIGYVFPQIGSDSRISRTFVIFFTVVATCNMIAAIIRHEVDYLYWDREFWGRQAEYGALLACFGFWVRGKTGIVFVLLGVMVITLGGSRGSTIGLIIIMITYARYSHRQRLFQFLTVIIIMLALVNVLSEDYISDKFLEIYYSRAHRITDLEIGLTGRDRKWTETFDYLAHNDFNLLSGIGNYTFGSFSHYIHPHNTFFLYWIEGGILAMITYLIFIGSLIRRLYRKMENNRHAAALGLAMIYGVMIFIAFFLDYRMGALHSLKSGLLFCGVGVSLGAVERKTDD